MFGHKHGGLSVSTRTKGCSEDNLEHSSCEDTVLGYREITDKQQPTVSDLGFTDWDQVWSGGGESSSQRSRLLAAGQSDRFPGSGREIQA